jgi:hypothetical protein
MEKSGATLKDLEAFTGKKNIKPADHHGLDDVDRFEFAHKHKLDPNAVDAAQTAQEVVSAPALELHGLKKLIYDHAWRKR